MFNHDLRESRVWLKLLYFDQIYSVNHLLNKLKNHFIILYLFYLQTFEEVCILCSGFYLSYLNDLTKREQQVRETDCVFIALNKIARNCLLV